MKTEGLTFAQLRRLAEGMNIQGWPRLRKSILKAALESHFERSEALSFETQT